MNTIVILAVALGPVLILALAIQWYSCSLDRRAKKLHDELQQQFTQCKVTLANGKSEKATRATRQQVKGA